MNAGIGKGELAKDMECFKLAEILSRHIDYLGYSIMAKYGE